MTRTRTYEVLEGTDGLAALRADWESLEEAGADHIFQTYAYAELWHRTIGAPTGAQPLLILLRENGRAVGIFPACRVRQNGVPLLTWLGAPRLLDYGDVVFDATAAQTPIDDFVAESLRLLARGARGAFLYLPNVRDDARAFGPLRTILRTFRTSAAPFVPIVGTWEEYIAGRSRALRKDLKKIHRADAAGGVECRLLAPDDPGIPAALARLVEFQRARFDGPLNSTTLYDERYVRFRSEQASEPFSRVATVSVRGRLVAVALGAVFRGRYYSIVPGFDREYSEYSPGVQVQAFIIRECFANGWDPCDFCWGNEPHKYRWTDSAVTLTTFVGAGLGGAVLAGGAGARHRAIALIDRLRGKARSGRGI